MAMVLCFYDDEYLLEKRCESFMCVFEYEYGCTKHDEFGF